MRALGVWTSGVVLLAVSVASAAGPRSGAGARTAGPTLVPANRTPAATRGTGAVRRVSAPPGPALGFAEEEFDTAQGGPVLQPPVPGGMAPEVLPEGYVTPQVEGELLPGFEPQPLAQCSVPLYGRVRYRQERKTHPCAVPMFVMIPDPCWRPDPRGPCDQVPPCVAVEVCVPPCSVCPPKITCRRRGALIRYDFGKYAVNIRTVRGQVVVDYDS
ncbi:MAG: hypothetical protein ACKO3P_12125 [Planctomycetaceae bacterium]